MKFTLRSLALVALLGVVSCEKDDPEVINEVEVFSNFTLTLTPVHDDADTDHDHEESVEYHWHDENGDLVIDADEIEAGELEAGTTYSALISLNEHDEDEDEGDAHNHAVNTSNSVLSDDDGHDHEHGDDVDAEILGEAAEHQFFFSEVDGLTVTYEDADENGNPLGLETTFTTEDTYNGGDLTITLIHQPNKSGDGVKDGDITNAGGEKDIAITFSLGVHAD